VWAYDFVEVRNHDGRKFCILAIIDEASREYLALFVAREIRSVDVLAILAELFVIHRPSAHIRPDNDPEFIAITLKEWLAPVGMQIFQSLAETQILIEAWRRHYNTVRPHSLLGFSLPAPEAVPWPVPSYGSASLCLRPALAKEAIMHQRSSLIAKRGPVTVPCSPVINSKLAHNTHALRSTARLHSFCYCPASIAASSARRMSRPILLKIKVARLPKTSLLMISDTATDVTSTITITSI
jgi:hypothetical protein